MILSCRQHYPQGEKLYLTYCVNCHMEDGSGLVRLIPPLDGSDFLYKHRETVPCIIRSGSPGGLEVNGIIFREKMPSFENLNEVEISNIINYIHTTWGNNLRETYPDEVKNGLKQCPIQ